jgi:hypothetical protein
MYFLKWRAFNKFTGPPGKQGYQDAHGTLLAILFYRPQQIKG